MVVLLRPRRTRGGRGPSYIHRCCYCPGSPLPSSLAAGHLCPLPARPPLLPIAAKFLLLVRSQRKGLCPPPPGPPQTQARRPNSSGALLAASPLSPSFPAPSWPATPRTEDAASASQDRRLARPLSPPLAFRRQASLEKARVCGVV